jgi:tyrosinase
LGNQVETSSVTRATLHHRRSVAKLTPQQLTDLREAFRAAMRVQDDRGFWYFAGWHGVPFNWCEHHTELFLPWHRAYLYYFELALHEQVPGVSLPWWDWTTMSKIPSAYTVKTAGGRQNPLLVRKVEVYRSGQSSDVPERTPGAAPVPSLPYKTRWDNAMKATSFGDFQQRIERIHDDVHVWVGGIMGDITWAAYDPLFYAHHVMIDRAWRIWQHRHPGALPRSGLLDVALRPNGLKVRDTLDVKQLGYDYAGTASHAPGTVP